MRFPRYQKVAIGFLLILLISGCTEPPGEEAVPNGELPIAPENGQTEPPDELPSPSPPDTMAPSQLPPAFPAPQPPRQSAGTGCDNICDSFEQQHPESGCYKPDCLGIYEDRTEPSPATPPHEAMPTQIEVGEKEGINTLYVVFTNATYRSTDAEPRGWFTNGQEADILLSGIDFNNAGGPLLFNHPGSVATDGTHLLLADRNNNRVLIWNSLPNGNTPPDLVLGQPDFIWNNPGTERHQLNWPVSIATANGKVIVADTYNNRILIWNSFPTENGQPADLEIADDRNDPRRSVGWPWAVWTDGTRVIVTSTAGAAVSIWNTFPARDNAPADIVLHADGDFGTPRSIATDGRHLMIGDHNAKPNEGRPGNFFWKSFPAESEAPYDFFVTEPFRMGEIPPSGTVTPGGDILWGGMTPDGKLIGLANMLYLWNTFPENENDAADLKVGGVPGQTGYDFGGSQSGDGSSLATAGERIYFSLSNGNKIVGYNALPTKPDQEPDFVIGAPDIYTNTLRTNYIISNPRALTDGNSLFVVSDFDGRMNVWKHLPDESGAHPDISYDFGMGYRPWSETLHNGRIITAAGQEVYGWSRLPLAGEMPDIHFKDRIGNAQLQDIRGVALDYRYFYLGDRTAKKIYIWKGVPSNDSNPDFTLSSEHVGRLSSDGNYLVTTTVDIPGGAVVVFRLDDLPRAEPIVLAGRFNLPQGALVSNGRLFVADTGFSRVLIWNSIEDAIDGEEADIMLGDSDRSNVQPEIGKNKLFWPASLAFDGSYLWVGEYKFSERLLRFSVKP